MEYYCCDLHHSSYCPECRGDTCEARVLNNLDPDEHKRRYSMRDPYKVKQLEEMLKWEEKHPEDQQYGAHLMHWSGHGNPINIDAGALRMLIQYYSEKVVVL